MLLLLAWFLRVSLRCDSVWSPWKVKWQGEVPHFSYLGYVFVTVGLSWWHASIKVVFVSVVWLQHPLYSGPLLEMPAFFWHCHLEQVLHWRHRQSMTKPLHLFLCCVVLEPVTSLPSQHHQIAKGMSVSLSAVWVSTTLNWESKH